MKYVLVPISTLGCGKSTTFRTLTNLFPDWAHIENDNSSSKRQFFTLIEDALKKSNVLLFDRNNHLLNHRKEISRILKADNIRLVALVFVDEKIPLKKLWDTTFERIKKRGDNHQTIKSSSDAGLAKRVTGSFIKQFQPFNLKNEGDRDFQPLQMTLKGQSSKENARRILEFLHKEDPEIVPEVLSDEQLQRLFEQALTYSVPPKDDKSAEDHTHRSRGNGSGEDTTKHQSETKKPKTSGPSLKPMSTQSSISAFFEPVKVQSPVPKQTIEIGTLLEKPEAVIDLTEDSGKSLT